MKLAEQAVALQRLVEDLKVAQTEAESASTLKTHFLVRPPPKPQEFQGGYWGCEVATKWKAEAAAGAEAGVGAGAETEIEAGVGTRLMMGLGLGMQAHMSHEIRTPLNGVSFPSHNGLTYPYLHRLSSTSCPLIGST